MMYSIRSLLLMLGAMVLLNSMAAQAQEATDQEVSSSAASSISDWVSTTVNASMQMRSGKDRVAFGSNAELPADEVGRSVVAIGGNASAAGAVSDSVVAIMGNTRVTAPVGNAVVTLLGNSYVNSSVNRDVVTVMGDLELGPQAVIHGKVVSIGGKLIRDPAAVMREPEVVSEWPAAWSFDWLKHWIKDCLLLGRLLAFDATMMWAWYVALVSLLLYVATAAMVPQTVERCVTTLESWPGRSLLAALISIPVVPICMLLLVMTIVGIALIPFFVLALLTLAWFGKLVLLAWMGKQVLRRCKAPQLNWAWAVLIGGLIATLLYTIPVIGLLSYKLLQFIGFGAVLYVLVLMFYKPARDKSERVVDEAPAMPSGSTTSADQPRIHGDATSTSGSPAAMLPCAGFWPRMGALFIDVILISLVLSLITNPVRMVGFMPYRHGLPHNGLLLALAVYGAVMWKLKGTTVGGLIFHLNVVRRDGQPLDWATCVVRALGCFLSLAVLGLGFIWIGIDANKQGWHDKLAGTLVVREPQGRALL